jgi:site-specific DNA recombinase
MRVAIYVRVSTQRQAQTQTINQQLDRLRKAASDRGWSLAEENVFRDDGYSGASLRRPGLDRLRDQAALARLDAILITDPDRLARNFVHQALLLEELQRHGCKVEFTDRPLSDDPQDQLLLQIRGAVAEYERTLIAERTRRGRLHKLRSGQMLPWTRPPYGYRADPDRPRDPAGVRADPTESALVAEMFDWYAREGRSMLGLAGRLRELGVPSPTGKEYWGQATIRGILSNPTYTGTLYANRTRARPAKVRRSSTHPIGEPRDSQAPLPAEQWVPIATVPAIVTRELFDRVQAKIATNRAFARRNNTAADYLLRALVSCGGCGLACQARRTLPTGKTYYVCTGKNLQVRRRTGTTCRSRFVPSGLLDDLVWSDLADLLRRPDRVTAALRRAAGGCWLPQELKARQENLRRGRASLAQQVERLTEAYLSGVVPLAEYQRRRAELERRDGSLVLQQEQLSGEASRASEVAGLVTAAEDFARRVEAGLDAATFERRRELVELLIDRVVVTGETVEIRYVLPIGPAGESGRFCHLRVDYFRTPHLVRPRDRHTPQQVRVDPMPAARRTQLRLGVERLQAHDPHQPPHPLAVDRLPLPGQPGRQPPAAEERVGRVLPVDQRHQPQVVRRLRGRLVIQAGAAQPQQRALPADAQLRVTGLDERPQLVRRAGRLFFSATPAPS